MFQNKADFTNTYNRLLYPASVQSEIYEHNEFQEWQKEWKKRIATENDWQLIMQKSNPVYIPRNHLVEAVLDELITTGKNLSFEKYMERLSAPYAAPNFDSMYMQPPSSNDDQCYKTYCGT